MKYNPSNLVIDIPALACLPEILGELNSALSNPSSTMADFGEIIENDSSLTARILKVANSSFFGFPSKIETIPQAITLIGTQEVRDLVFATKVIRTFPGVPEDLVDMKSFWEHSLACGLAAKVLAIQKRMPYPEQFFVAGLLHDIGRLILFLKIPEASREVLAFCCEHEMPLLDGERKLLGFDHADVGGELMKLWQIPTPIFYGVRYHHQPMSADIYPVEAAIIHVADIIVHAMEIGTSGTRRVPPLKKQAWTRVGIQPSSLEPCMDQIDREFVDVVKMFLHD